MGASGSKPFSDDDIEKYILMIEDDRRKKEVLKKYGRKRNFQFFNDTIESDDEF